MEKMLKNRVIEEKNTSLEGLREEIIWTSILCISFFLMGICATMIYQDFTNKRAFDGLNIRNLENKTDAITYAKTYDNNGDWVCVNIKGMEFKKAVEVCNHEVGHEIFAEVCEKDIDKCLEVIGK